MISSSEDIIPSPTTRVSLEQQSGSSVRIVNQRSLLVVQGERMYPFPRPQVPDTVMYAAERSNDNPWFFSEEEMSMTDSRVDVRLGTHVEVVDITREQNNVFPLSAALPPNVAENNHTVKPPDVNSQQRSNFYSDIGLWNELSQFQEELRIYLFRRALPNLPGYVKTVITCDMLLLGLYMEKRRQASKQNIFLDNCYVLYSKLRSGSVVEWNNIITLSFYFHVKDNTGSFLHSYLRVLRILSTYFYNGALQGIIGQLEGRYYALYLPHGIFPSVV